MKSIVETKYSERNIISDITSFISEKHLEKGTKLMSSARMAEKYNVSPITVNRAINKLVQKGILYRIQGGGTYVAKCEHPEKQFRAGLYLYKQNASESMIQAAFGQTKELLLAALSDMGFKVDFIAKPLLYDVNIRNEPVAKYDVLIIAAGMLNLKNSSLLETRGMPVISMLGDKILPYPIHQVFYNYESGFKKAAEYIKSKGHRKIYIASAHSETSNNRRTALAACLKAAGLEYVDLPAVRHESLDSLQLVLNARETGKYLLDNNIRGPVFSLSDFISFGIMDVLRERGLKLGEDMELLSYDNLESRGICPYGEPVLTCISHPIERMVNEVAKLAEDILKNNINANEINKIIRINADEFVIRKSS